MPSDSGAAHGVARLLYPELPVPLTPADLHRLYTPSYDERNWARTVARTPLSQVVLLVQLADLSGGRPILAGRGHSGIGH